MTDLPNPMTPPDCDLRGYEYMPLFGHKLFGSTLYAEATDAEFRASIKLWWSAWNQCPAGSLPKSDAALAMLADYGRDLKGWAKVRTMALRGFVLCSDDRLYHPHLSEAAITAYALRLKANSKRKADAERLRLWRETKRKDGGPDDSGQDEMPSETTSETRFDTPDETPDVAPRREGKGREVKEEEDPVAEATDAAGASSPSSPRERLWSEGLPILTTLVGTSPKQTRALMGKLLGKIGDDCPRMLAILHDAEQTYPADPVAWLTAAVAPSPTESGPERRIREQREAMWRMTYPDADEPFIDHQPEALELLR